MANTSSAKKANRVALRRRVFNIRRTRVMKDSIKEVARLISEKKGREALALLGSAYQAIDKAVKRGVIKANKGAREKSKLALGIKKLG